MAPPLGIGLLGGVLLALGGCGDMYYQTRYIPESVDEVYSPSEQIAWTGDKEVYELPANPPAVDTLHRARVDCKTPGQQFKSQAMLGIGDSRRHPETAEPVLVGRLDHDPMAGNPFPPQKEYPVGVPGDGGAMGARDRIGLIPVGGIDQGPYPFRGSGTEVSYPGPMGAYRDDQTIWCAPK